ncbi:hypothetical protein V4F39_20845 [Aquincola sp. MAHUQ-54]|uniref:Tli3-like domain-containing protein n=1 Tax=Aquincola agrisoli TaxID=3119538 RepID=A0AAW9Q975_9BURK
MPGTDRLVIAFLPPARTGGVRRRCRGVAMALAAALLPGCALLGHGELQNLPDWDTFPRAPKQIVYRFDEHRYIENDPAGGFVSPCQGELYYVDEKLGIRTYFSVNTQGNPGGRFKVDSPYVVVRAEKIVKISFDQGRTFAVLDVPYSGDLVVTGTAVFRGWYGKWSRYEFDPHAAPRIISVGPNFNYPLVSVQGSPAYSPEAKSAAEAKLMEPGPGSTEFVCRSDLPWRPSVKREREMQQRGVQP